MASQQLVAFPEAEWHQTGVGEREGFKEEAVFAVGLEGVEGLGTGPGHPHMQTPGAEARLGALVGGAQAAGRPRWLWA